MTDIKLTKRQVEILEYMADKLHLFRCTTKKYKTAYCWVDGEEIEKGDFVALKKAKLIERSPNYIEVFRVSEKGKQYLEELGK